jgi:poly(beta-D-mannuronate) lyase
MFVVSVLRLSVFLSLFLIIVGCGGGGETPIIAAPAAPPIGDDTGSDDGSGQSCSNQQHTIVLASDDGTFDSDYAPGNAIDTDTASDSRWSSEGVSREIVFDLGAVQMVGSLNIKWYQGASRQANFSVETSSDNSVWQSVLADGISSGRHSGFEQVDLSSSEGRYIKIIGTGNSENNWNSIIEVTAHSCEGADGKIIDVFPNELGIDLLDWYLSVPTDEDGSGTSDSIFEGELAAGYTNSEFFYASADNGIVMKSPSYGFKTSTNTKYVRSELREMLRRGDTSISTQGVNKNNWVFSSASPGGQADAGGSDGELNVTLAVNNVTTTGEDYQIGRLVIGQIHANDDEPVRLYYRKLPNNDKGSIYFAHESRVEDADGDNIETYVEMIGSRSNSASNPSDGVALDEKFSYRINVNANLLTVTIIREGKDDVQAEFDMTDSLYDQDGQYQYFKVGVYHLNNSSGEDEYAQATFYEIRNSHTGYGNSE